MKVIPDVLPNLHPSIDLHVTARASFEEFKKTKKSQVAIEPGTFLLPEQVGDANIINDHCEYLRTVDTDHNASEAVCERFPY